MDMSAWIGVMHGYECMDRDMHGYGCMDRDKHALVYAIS